MPKPPAPFVTDEQKKTILTSIKEYRLRPLLSMLGVTLHSFYALRKSDPSFWLAYQKAHKKAESEHSRLKADLVKLSAELETANRKLAEYAELLRWRLTEKEPPTEIGYYETWFPNIHGSYDIDLWMPNEFIDREPDDQPPYWRPIIDNEPDYENLP